MEPPVVRKLTISLLRRPPAVRKSMISLLDGMSMTVAMAVAAAAAWKTPSFLRFS